MFEIIGILFLILAVVFGTAPLWYRQTEPDELSEGAVMVASIVFMVACCAVVMIVL